MNRREAPPEFHPQTLLRDWGGGEGFRIADALTGVIIFGGTGSGKTSGPARHIAYAYLAGGFGGLVLVAKKEEVAQWKSWAAATGRSDDLVIVDKKGTWRFNALDWEAARPEEGGGLTINICALLEELSSVLTSAGGKGDGGDNKFWADSLHLMLTNLVDLPLFAGIRVSLPLLRSIVTTAPQSLEEVQLEQWQESSACAAILREADKATLEADAETRADFEECASFWRQEFPALSEKTRSIITLSFSMMSRPFTSRPLRRLFSSDTNITPEATFEGKIIVVDLAVQEFRLAGRLANLVWKFAFQVAVLRRSPPVEKGRYLRPVFLYADEVQYFATRFDSEYQAVARSAGGCTVYITQNRESLRRVLGDNDAVDSLLGNLQCKVFAQNAGETNEWAARLLGERWIDITGTNVSTGGNGSLSILGQSNERPQHSAGISRSPQRRHFVEPAAFTTLKRGGELNNYQVSAIAFNGGKQFESCDGSGELLPYKLLTFDQR